MNIQPVKLLDRVRHKIRLKHYSIRTEKAYISWIRRYIYFHDKRHPKEKAGLPSSVGNPAFRKGSVAFRPRVSTGLAFSASLEFNLSYNNFCKMSTPRLP